MKLSIIPEKLITPLKRILPASLFGRALLILIIPTVLVQVVATYIFFERHWDNVTRYMSASLAGEVAFIVHELHNAPPERDREIYHLARDLMGIHIGLREDIKTLPAISPKDKPFPAFRKELQRRLVFPFTVTREGEDSDISIQILLPEGLLKIEVSRKRLVSPTTDIFVMWMVGTAVLLLSIATLFLRNQIRPITKLAEAAEKFGRGEEIPDFRPAGAQEVRRAGRAFLVMRERIRRQITTRTEMLAGISHDLRTPLTRLKLGLEMLGKDSDTKPLAADVSEMQRMVDEYLDFARGEGREETSRIPLSVLLGEVVENYRRQQKTIPVTLTQDAELSLRHQAMKRCLTNVIDNALRYGKQCAIHARLTDTHAEIVIDDDGPGIALEHRTLVFHPFKRLDPSRNLNAGGVGLGLTIARDVMQSHGGTILLGDSPTGGLRVTLTLPK